MFQIHRLWGNSLVFSYFLSVPGPTLSEKMCSFYFANTYFLTVLDFPEEVARADVSGKAWKCSEKERGSEFEYLWGMGSSLGARLNGSLLWWVTVHSVLFDSWGGWPQSQQFKPRPVQRKKKKEALEGCVQLPAVLPEVEPGCVLGICTLGLVPRVPVGVLADLCVRALSSGMVPPPSQPCERPALEPEPGSCVGLSLRVRHLGLGICDRLTLIRTLCAQRGMGLIAVSQVKDTFCHGLAILYW